MEWISVKDKIPGNNDIVIVSCELGVTMSECTIFPDGDKMWWAIQAIGTYDDSVEVYEVTHWMPLPEPPKED